MRAFPLVVPFAILALALGGLAHADEAADARGKALEGFYPAAIEAAKAAVKADPDDLRSARLAQDLLLLLSRDAEAEEFAQGIASMATSNYLQLRLAEPKVALNGFKKLKGQDDAPEFTQLDYAWAALRADKTTVADSEVKAFLRDHPEEAEAHYLLGRVAWTRGSAKNAQPALEKALELVPGYPQAAVLLAEVLASGKEPSQARTVLATALGHYSSNPLLRLGLGADQARTGELDAADATLTALAEERADFAPAHANLAHVIRLKGRPADAVAIAKKALALDPDHVVALETVAFALFKAKDLDGAMETYGKVIRLDPTRVEPYAIIGFCQLMNRRVDDAKAMLEKALDLDKSHVGANLKMGVISFVRGKNRDAKKHFTVVLKQQPENITALRHMGYLSLGAGKAKEALKTLQKALQLEPDDAKTVRMVGRAYFDLGKKEEAKEMFLRAVDLDEKDPWAYFDLGKANDDAGEFEAAKQDYAKAIDLDKTFPWPHLYLAELYDDVDGDAESALEHYQEFLKLGGPDPDKTVEKRIEQLSED